MRNGLLYSGVVLGIATLCSAEAQTPSSVAAGPPSSSVSAPRTVPLEFKLRGRELGLPLVRASVSGLATWLVVDTGAATTMLSESLVRELALPTETIQGTTFNQGGGQDAARIIREPPLFVPGLGKLSARPVLVHALPELLERMGIGGVLAPQQFMTADTAVILDLRLGELSLVTPAPVDALGATRGAVLGGKDTRTCRLGPKTVGAQLATFGFILAARVEGHPIDLLLDSGASVTALDDAAPASRALALRAVDSRAVGLTAAGTQKRSQLPGVKLQVGAVERTLNLALRAAPLSEGCVFSGVLGMDLLKSCVLVFYRDQVSARCGD